MTPQEQIKIIQAHTDNKKLRYWNRYTPGYKIYVGRFHLFNFMDNIYEIVDKKSDDWMNTQRNLDGLRV